MSNARFPGVVQRHTADRPFPRPWGFMAWWGWWLPCLGLGLGAGPGLAQLVPDRTLGIENSTVRETWVRGGMADLIEGGSARGSSLFHSFLEFSLEEGGRVYFANPSGIDTIFSRVTGLRESQIDGLLGVDGSANLFLLNPHGIMFGPQARLDLSGSFQASTAQTFLFAPGTEFSAVDPQAPPLLTIQPSPQFIYGADFLGNIVNQGHLEVGPGQTLTLAGATVTSTGYLGAPGGTVQMLGDQIYLLDNAKIQVSSEVRGGTVRLGGDYQGQGTLPRAQRTWVGPQGVIEANALGRGAGGEIIIWSDHLTHFAGTALALGGGQGGDGGRVETSSQGVLRIPDGAIVGVAATAGRGGQWLLDPYNVTIQATGDDLPGDGNPPVYTPDDSYAYDPTANDSTVTVGSLETALNSGAHVMITTGSGSDVTTPQSGKITIADSIFAAGSRGNLTLQAAHSIIFNAPMVLGTGTLLLEAPTLDFSSGNAPGIYTLTALNNQGLTGTLSGAGITSSGALVFQKVNRVLGGTGTDTLVSGPGHDTFTITGDQAGTLDWMGDGSGLDLSFQNMEVLSGAGGNDGVIFSHPTFGGEIQGGTGTLTLRGDEMNWGGAISGSGNLIIEPITLEKDILMGGAVESLPLEPSRELDLGLADLQQLQGGFTAIQIQTSGSITVGINPISFLDGVSLVAGSESGDRLTVNTDLNLPIASNLTLQGHEIVMEGNLTVPSGRINLLGDHITIDRGTVNVDGVAGAENGGQIRIGKSLDGSRELPNSQAQATTTSATPASSVNIGLATAATLTAQPQGTGSQGSIVLFIAQSRDYQKSNSSQVRPTPIVVPLQPFRGVDLVAQNIFIQRGDRDATGHDTQSLTLTGLGTSTLGVLYDVDQDTFYFSEQFLENYTDRSYVLSAIDRFEILSLDPNSLPNPINTLSLNSRFPEFRAGHVFTMPSHYRITAPGDFRIAVGSDLVSGTLGVNTVLTNPNNLTVDPRASLTVGAMTAAGNLELASLGNLTVLGNLSTLGGQSIALGAVGDASIQGSLITKDYPITLRSKGNLDLSRTDTSATNFRFVSTLGGAITLESWGNHLRLGTNIDTTYLGANNNAGGDIVAIAHQGDLQVTSRLISQNKGGGLSRIWLESLEGDVILSGARINAANAKLNPIPPDFNSFAGDILVNANGTITLANSSISTAGYGGRIVMGTSDLSIDFTDNADPLADSIQISNSTIESSNSIINGVKNSGAIEIRGGAIEITNSTVDTSTTGEGDAGAITIAATTDLSLDRTSIEGTTNGTGSASLITLLAGENLNLTNASSVSSSTVKSGGASGNIQLTGQNINVTGGSVVQAVSKGTETGTGAPGNITATFTGAMEVSGMSLFGQLSELSTSSGANANLSTSQGSITINAPTGTLTLDNRGRINALTQSTNPNYQGGAISILVNGLNIQGGSQVLATSSGAAKAGNILINANRISIDGSAPSFADALENPVDLSEFVNFFGDATPQFDGSTLSSIILSSGVEALSVGALQNALNITRIPNSPTGESPTEGSGVTFKTLGRTLTADWQFLSSDRLPHEDFGFFASGSHGSVALLANAFNQQAKATQDPEANVLGSITAQGDALSFGVVDVKDQQNDASLTLRNIKLDGLSIHAINPQFDIQLTQPFTSGIFVQATGSGSAGSVTLNAPTIQLSNQGTISASTLSGGFSSPANINLQQVRTLELTDSQILASTATGEAGSIFINQNDAPLPNLILQGNSLISVAAKTVTQDGQETAGLIQINGNQVTLTGNTGGRSVISAATEKGSSQGIRFQNLRNLEITQGDIVASTIDGNAPDLRLGSPDLILDRIALQDGTLSVAATGFGNSGQLSLYTRALTATQNSLISASTHWGTSDSILLPSLRTLDLLDSRIQATTIQGVAGSVIMTALDHIAAQGTLGDGSAAGISVQATQGGKAGGITLNTPHLRVAHGAVISAEAGGTAEGGDITLQPGLTGDHLAIDFANHGSITASTQGTQAGGSLFITAPQSVTIRGLGQVAVETSGAGNAGRILLTTQDFSLMDGAILSGSTSSRGNAGAIDLTTSRLTLTDQARIQSNTSAGGQAGDITLTTAFFNLSQGAQVLAETRGPGAGGTVAIHGSSQVRLGNSPQEATPIISVKTSGPGRAGNIQISTPEFILAASGEITATATATATTPERGGSISIQANTLDLAGVVGVFAETQGSTPAGTLSLSSYRHSPTLTATFAQGATISASTAGGGNGGDFFITAPQAIILRGVGKLAVETTGTGNAGTFEITTENLTLSDGIEVSASTYSPGAQAGRAGDIQLTSTNLTLSRGASVRTNTFGAGDSGNIKVNTTRILDIDGGSMEATTGLGSTGNGGNIDIDPTDTYLRQGGRIAVDSQGTGTGGSIRLVSDNLYLDNGSISAVTRSSDGGNITLVLQNVLRMVNGSYISTEAGTASSGGNGGDLRIKAQFVIAGSGSNSDMIANAFEGNGGSINIDALGIFGFDVRNVNNPRQNPRNNLTASSRFGTSGTVNARSIDLSQGLILLPANLIDPSRLIDRSCSLASSARQSKFTIAGRGGLTLGPHSLLVGRTITLDLRPSPSDAGALGLGFSRAAVPEADPEAIPKTLLSSAPAIAFAPCGP